MFCGVILPPAPTVASTLGALSAKLETFKRMQTCAHKPKLLGWVFFFFFYLNETKTKSWTAFRGNPLRLQRATICPFASEMIWGIYLITFVCCQSPLRVQLVLDLRRSSRSPDAPGAERSGQSRSRWLPRCLSQTRRAQMLDAWNRFSRSI